jgi:O-antigen ligase
VVLRRVRPNPLIWAVLAWVGANALATAFALSPRLSLLGELGQREGLLTALALAGLHLASGHAHRGEAQVRTTLTAILAAGLVAAIYAQLQLAGLDPIRWQGMHTYTTQGGIALRPSSTLGNPVLLGAVLAAVLPVALVRLASARGDATRLVPAAALLAASLVVTLSRGAWLAAAIGTVASIGVAGLAGAHVRRIAWTAAGSLAPALLFGVARASGPIVQRLAETVDGHTLATRELIARAAMQLWRQHPVAGVGPDAFGLAFPRVQDPALWRAEWIGMPAHAHSVPLQVLATLGVAGALAGLAWLVAAALAWVGAWRMHRPARFTLAAIAGALLALVVAGATNVVGLAGAALFAVLSALPGTVEERPEKTGPRLHRDAFSLPIAAVAVMLVVGLFSGARELTALTLARATRDGPAREQATPSEWRALTTVRARSAWEAARRRPDEDQLWRLACDAALAEAEALGAAGFASVESAEQAARRALALVPARAAAHERLANALAARALRTGSSAAADSADGSYARAAALAPADGWLLVSWIRFQLARRDGVRAHELAERLTGLYPGAAVGHTLAGAALLLLERRTEARAELRQAQAARWEPDAGAQRAAVDRLVTELERERPSPRRARRRTGRR